MIPILAKWSKYNKITGSRSRDVQLASRESTDSKCFVVPKEKLEELMGVYFCLWLVQQNPRPAAFVCIVNS